MEALPRLSILGFTSRWLSHCRASIMATFGPPLRAVHYARYGSSFDLCRNYLGARDNAEQQQLNQEHAVPAANGDNLPGKAATWLTLLHLSCAASNAAVWSLL